MQNTGTGIFVDGLTVGASTAIKVNTNGGNGLVVNSTTGRAGYFASGSGTYPTLTGYSSNNQPGVYAEQATFGASTTALFASALGGTGVEARCTAVNCNNGVYGFSSNPVASCVIGQSSADVQGYGIVGRSYGSGTAVFGDMVGPTTGRAGLFNGAVHVNGVLSKLGGTFRIDHPQDPANKFLVHSFVESPEMKNVYDGVVVIGVGGTAVIRLPSYFESLNTDFRYQLTAIGSPANLYVSREVANNEFQIAGGTQGQKVSWQVTGVRKDAWARSNPVVVEEAKSAEERGKYLTPQFISSTAEALIRRPLDAVPSTTSSGVLTPNQ